MFLPAFGWLKLGTPFTLEDNGPSNPNLYQTSLDLAALGLNRTLASITFWPPANAAAQQNTAIFAVSGSERPPTVLTVLPAANGTLLLSWAGGGTLLQSTNLSGPWTTNTSASPATITPLLPDMFYRVQTE